MQHAATHQQQQSAAGSSALGGERILAFRTVTWGHIALRYSSSPYSNHDHRDMVAQVDEKAVQTPFDSSGRVQITFAAKSCPSRSGISAQQLKHAPTYSGIIL
jgi:DNA-binding transcriptional regulator/RsmH inhibitor MraZ